MGNLFSFINNEKTKPIKFEHPKNPFHVLCFGYTFEIKQKNINNILATEFAEKGIILSNQVNNLSKIKWSTATNTKNGVNAAAQILSFKSDVQQDIIPLVNKDLREKHNIFLFDETDTNFEFNSRRFADGQLFCYIVKNSSLLQASLNLSENASSTLFHNSYLYRQLKEVVFPEFVRNTNYHNYTKESPVERIVFSIKISHIQINNEMFYIFKFHGKSFGRSQIQRIMTMILAYIYGKATIETIRRTFSKNIWKISKCPNYCMFLEKVDFRYYIDRFMKPRPNRIDVEFTSQRPTIEKWKNEVLFPYILAEMEKNDIDKKIFEVAHENPPKFVSTPIVYMPIKQPE
ncbi:tRNA pseudouridine synthase family protein [Tritrichomonas foetus]|uniref:tRNA pseudouridine synthase family protein n=1 Tax=Tritrichomonas foetus TaxID=1144522 RepID=A0A1J4L205_9EUKA|nr:tRNA pseudouridine synthase family protein [Tritrichomonas foetus]|eukprot:OHT16004.1 tRNA pseudouridine synthase family protein [Tritrichomonas foetus]